jgi:phage baseplate assembly protein W
MSANFASNLRDEIKTAILFHEPRITLDRVRLEPSPESEGLIEIRIEYTVSSTNSRNNLVYPFYVNEATDA